MKYLTQLYKKHRYLFAGIFGSISNPTNYSGDEPGEGLFMLLINIFRLVAVVAGIFMIFKFISAGLMYISASGDTKKTEAAWATIWQSILGLVIVASAFVLAGVVGRLLNIDIINPQIYGPIN